MLFFLFFKLKVGCKKMAVKKSCEEGGLRRGGGLF